MLLARADEVIEWLRFRRSWHYIGALEPHSLIKDLNSRWLCRRANRLCSLERPQPTQGMVCFGGARAAFGAWSSAEGWMRRRDFIMAVGGAAACPKAA
jgi:hypothetical protein